MEEEEEDERGEESFHLRAATEAGAALNRTRLRDDVRRSEIDETKDPLTQANWAERAIIAEQPLAQTPLIAKRAGGGGGGGGMHFGSDREGATAAAPASVRPARYRYHNHGAAAMGCRVA